MACLQLWFVFPATFLPLVWLHRPGHRRTAQHGAPLSGRHSQKIFLLSKQVILGPNHKYCIAANFKRFPPCTPRWNCGIVEMLAVRLCVVRRRSCSCFATACYLYHCAAAAAAAAAWRDGAPQKQGLGTTETENPEQQRRRGDGQFSRGEIS